MTWLIQLPLGQYIEIVFVYFDVGYKEYDSELKIENCRFVFLFNIPWENYWYYTYLNFRYSSLALYDGDSIEAPIMGRRQYCVEEHCAQHCGQKIPDKYKPSLLSSTNNVFIHFQSDQHNNNQYGGFKLEYSKLC